MGSETVAFQFLGNKNSVNCFHFQMNSLVYYLFIRLFLICLKGMFMLIVRYGIKM